MLPIDNKWRERSYYLPGTYAVALRGFYNGQYRLSYCSHHSKTRPVKERKSIQKWASSVQWMGLVIINTESGEVTDTIGYVEFRAMYMDNGLMQEIHEKSLFERENQSWVYVSGVHF